MILLGIIILSLLLAYKALAVGLLPVLSRFVMGALAIGAGVGLAGPLRESIPSENHYLFGACMLTISLGAYGLLRALAMYYMLEHAIALPGLIDRAGGALCAFLGGMMLGGFACLAVLAFPLPRMAANVEPELRRSAEFGLAAARVVGVFAGTGQRLTLRSVLPRERPAPPTSAPATSPSATPGKDAETDAEAHSGGESGTIPDARTADARYASTSYSQSISSRARASSLTGESPQGR